MTIASREMTAQLDVAIVGAGASGTVLAAQLARARPGIHLALVDPAGFARGLAYSTPDPVHLLNVPAGKMSALEQEPGHFHAWLRAQGHDVTGDAFVPRGVYGSYLEALLGDARALARAAGGELHLFKERADELSRTDRGTWIVRLASGEGMETRAVVLALGNFDPEPLPFPGAAALATSGVGFQSPWVPGALEKPEGDGAVLLVGAGLTAVDAALALTRRGFAGKLVALSRHGMIPEVHRPARPYAGVVPAGRLRALVRAVRAAIREAQAQGSDWRAVVDSLRAQTPDLWRGFDAVERRRFVRHLRTHWDTHRHRMAPEVGAEVQRLMDAGQLEIRAGRLVSFEARGSGGVVSYAPRGQHGRAGTGAKLETLEVRRVINCTGPARLARAQSPLAQTLLRDGLARPDPLGMSFDVDAAGRILDAAGAPTPGLFTLGPPRRGESWESTAMPEIRGQAAALAKRLALELFVASDADADERAATL